MGFKLKTKGELFGINEELSEFGRPVFEKIWALVLWGKPTGTAQHLLLLI